MNNPLPLVAIGGTLCDERIWSFLTDQEDLRAIVVGTLPDGRLGDTGDMATYVEAMLDDLPPRFLLAGFSLGGLIALEMIAQAPERISGLALICAGAGAETPEGAKTRRLDENRAARVGMEAHAKDDIWPRFGACEATDAAGFVEMAQAIGSNLYQVQNDLAISRANSLPRLARIDGPVLLVSGGQDSLCPPSRHASIHAEIPQAKRFVIENAGHMICFDQPTRLKRLLDDWMAETRTAALHVSPPSAATAMGDVAL